MEQNFKPHVDEGGSKKSVVRNGKSAAWTRVMTNYLAEFSYILTFYPQIAFRDKVVAAIFILMGQPFMSPFVATWIFCLLDFFLVTSICRMMTVQRVI